MKKFIGISAICLMAPAQAAETQFYGDVLLRYENERSHLQLPDRERIRMIAHAGVKLDWDDTWSFNARLSTGLKNKQNVPAVTLHRFNDQPLPDRDIFVERLFATAKFGATTLHAGKIPWKTKQVTDVFWDRHLNPIGLHADVKFADDQLLQLATFKPLDGNSATVGHMSVIQYHKAFSFNDMKLTLSPWFVHYTGEADAQFARKDTQFDNQFVRLSTKLAFGPYQLGLDLGRSLEDFAPEQVGEFHDQKTSIAAEFKYGNLKEVGAYQAHLRYLHVERFSVVQEFAQNATSRFATANFKGWDFRLRRKMADDWWLGTRISDIQTLIGKQEEGIRFRIEAQYKF